MKPRSILALALLFASMELPALVLSELIVSGLPESERPRIEALLPFKAGSAFASMAELEAALHLAKTYLEQGREFGAVEMEAQEISETEAEVYVFLRPAAIAPRRVLDSEMTLIPNLPSYGLSLGFRAGAEDQLLGIEFPLARALAFDIAAGHTQSHGGVHAAAAKAGLSLRPIPLLYAYAFGALDAFPGSASPWPLDAAVQAGGILDLRFLARAYLFGAALEASYRKGFADFDYDALRAGAILAFEPLPFLSFEGATGIYSASGKASALAATGNAGTRDLRLRSSVAGDPKGLATASLTGALRLPWRIPLGIATLTASCFAFVEASSPYEVMDPAIADKLFGKTSSKAVGGGILLALSPPLSLVFEIGFGRRLEDGRPVFLFDIGS